MATLFSTHRRDFQIIANALHRRNEIIVDHHAGHSEKIHGTDEVQSNGTLQTLLLWNRVKICYV